MGEKIPIGIGNEKRVFLNEDRPDTVTARYREKLSDEEIKGVYYFSKLIHLLFPENYPEIFCAGNEKESSLTKQSIFVAGLIERDAILAELSRMDVIDEAYLIDGEPSVIDDKYRLPQEKIGEERLRNEKVQALIYDLREAGIPVDEYNTGNFSFQKDGHIIYLDIPQPFTAEDGKVTWGCSLKKLHTAIDYLPKDDPRVKLATTYISRLVNLYEQLSEKLR